MEITIKINGRMTAVEVSAEVAEYIVAAEGLLSCQYTPEDIVCQRETLALLLSILDTCTAIQRERFLLYALYDYTYDEIGLLYGCSKYAVRDSIEAVRKKFQNFFLD